MATVTLYSFEDAEGCPQTFTTFKAHEAREHGERWSLRVIAQEHEYADSETAWDFTGKDDEAKARLDAMFASTDRGPGCWPSERGSK